MRHYPFSALEALPETPGILGEVEFVLEGPLPETPRHLTLYEQESVPTTPAKATELAGRFGLDGPVYRAGKTFIAQNTDGAVRISALQQGYYTYQRNATPGPPQQLLDPKEALELARSYVEDRGLLDFERGPARLVSQGPKPPYRVLFPQMADGIPIDNAGVTVALSGDGQVTEVTGRVVQLRPVGKISIISPQEGYRMLRKRDPLRVFLVKLDQSDERSASQLVAVRVDDQRVLAPYSPGDDVSIEGVLQITMLGGHRPIRPAHSPLTPPGRLPTGTTQPNWASPY